MGLWQQRSGAEASKRTWQRAQQGWGGPVFHTAHRLHGLYRFWLWCWPHKQPHRQIPIENAPPVCQALCVCVPLHCRQEVMHAEGNTIQPSSSLWTALVILGKNKNGSLRLCGLQDQMRKHAYPLPTINNTIDIPVGFQWLAKCILASGGSWERWSQNHILHTRNLFKFSIMPFRLYNAPAIIQCLMN